MLTIIREGDMSSAVYKMQLALQASGFAVTADGRFGPGTALAVKDYQLKKGLAADGIAGAATIREMGLDLRPTKLTPKDFQSAAERLGCEVNVLRALCQVEAPAGGFDLQGRPTILFERHYFYKSFLDYPKPGQSPAECRAARDACAAENRDICYPKQLSFAKQRKNSAGVLVNIPPYDRYGPSGQQYSRLERARSFCEGAALESASWGKFQIMGENWSRIGWKSVFAFYRAMCASERDQLDALVGFIYSKPQLLTALRDKDWSNIARYYNGTGAVAIYAPKLRAAYNNM